MNLGQLIRNGVKWLLVAAVGRRMLGFAFGIVLARLLMPEDFGKVITIGAFIGFAGMFASGGMGQSLIRAKEVNEDDFEAVFTLQLAIGIVLYLGFFFASPWVAHFFEDPLYKNLLRVSALVFLMKPLAVMRTSWLSREMDFKPLSIVGVVVGLITGISSVLMALAGMGVWSLILSGLLATLANNILLARMTPLRLRLNFSRTLMRKHSAFGIKITASGFLTYLRVQGLNLLMSKLAGPAFLGLFNKADNLFRTPFQIVGSSVAQTVFRAMSKVQDDLDQTKYMYYRVVTLFGVYLLPFFVGLWWLAEPFIGGVYGEKWLPAAEPLRILVIAGLFRIVGHPCGSLLIAQNRLAQVLMSQIAGLIVAFSACLIGLNWGLVGVAWGLVLSSAFYNLYVYVLVYRLLPTRIADLLKAVAPGLLLNAMLFLILAATNYVVSEQKTGEPLLYLLLMAVPGSLVYAAAFLFLPIPELKTEAARWRQKLDGGLKFFYVRA